MAFIKEVIDSLSRQSYGSVASSLPKCFLGAWRNSVVIASLLIFSFVTVKIALEQIEPQFIIVDSISGTRVSDSGEFSQVSYDYKHSFHNVNISSSRTRQRFDIHVQGLLDSLHISTVAALTRGASQQDHGLKTEDAEEIRLWQKKYPCKAREQLVSRYERRRSIPNLKTPPEWTAVLDAYGKLHRACIKTSGDLTQLFMSEVNPDTAGGAPARDNGCKFLIAEAGNGVGNRVMWMMSCLLYAIVTKRVLLIDGRSRIPQLMCEPFYGSSWTAPSDFPFADSRTDLWQSHEDFLAALDKDTTRIPTTHALLAATDFGPTGRFFCPTEQISYSQVRWLTLGGCMYFLPKLFVIPSFRPMLTAIFKNPPTSPPLTHLLRTTMLPADTVWAQVRRAEEVFLQDAERQVGVHVRYRGGYEEYLDFHEVVNSNIKECMIGNNLLPAKANGNSSRWPNLNILPSHSRLKYSILFISSLYGSLYKAMLQQYPQIISNVTSVREVVGVVQLSKEGQQFSNLEVDERAMVEILCLSFSDVLLTSPLSTFSQLAQAYGGLSPWIINLRDRDQDPAGKTGPLPPCKRGKAIDGCYQGASATLVCPHEPMINEEWTIHHVRDLKPCEDEGGGMQFVP